MVGFKYRNYKVPKMIALNNQNDVEEISGFLYGSIIE